MVSRVHGFVLKGIDAVPCEVEVDLSPTGLPKTTIVGLPDTAVKESMERVRTAILNSGFSHPKGRITVNLAPADTPKEGPVYDLPIAVAMLLAGGTIDQNLPDTVCVHDYLVAGELALDGRVRPVRGAISLGLLAKRLGARGVILPKANANEAAAVAGIEVLGVSSLGQIVGVLNGKVKLPPHPPVNIEQMIDECAPIVDFEEIRGQEAAKRALTIAAAGGHNIIMMGPPGTGKTLLAKALSGILPPLTRDEVLEVSRIYSSVGQLPADGSLILRRKVRTPHHSASAAAIIGGGSIPRPGDVSLAHRGVLFLDEMPEFSRPVLETLRQPLEDGQVTIARARGSITFPARFMLVAALNPTAYGDVDQENGQREMDKYLSRLSRPLVDRIDIHIEVPAVPFELLTSARRGTDTESLRIHVREAREQQHLRQGVQTNAELSGMQLDTYAPLSDVARDLISRAMTELDLSARAYDRIRRVSRTIADLEGGGDISVENVAEAVQYRLLDRKRVLA